MRLMKSLRETARHNIEFKSRRLVAVRGLTRAISETDRD